MKKWLALILAAALLAAVFPLSALADDTEDLIWVVMHSQGVTMGQADKYPTTQELDDAVEAGSELIPADFKLKPGRITLLGTGSACSEAPVFDVTFKVWSTYKRPIALFFRAQDSDTWELAVCNLGDIIEYRFEACGDYAIAVGW